MTGKACRYCAHGRRLLDYWECWQGLHPPKPTLPAWHCFHFEREPGSDDDLDPNEKARG